MSERSFISVSTPKAGPLILSLTLTEEDVRQIVDNGNLGLALGEVPLDEGVSIAVVRTYLDVIVEAMRDTLCDKVEALTDRYGRVRPFEDDPTLTEV